MKAYRYLFTAKSPNGDPHPKRGQFAGFVMPPQEDVAKKWILEFDTANSSLLWPLCRFNDKTYEFEHRIGFDPTPIEGHLFGSWIWGKPAWCKEHPTTIQF